MLHRACVPTDIKATRLRNASVTVASRMRTANPAKSVVSIKSVAILASNWPLVESTPIVKCLIGLLSVRVLLGTKEIHKSSANQVRI